jgi:hypothetical protein
MQVRPSWTALFAALCCGCATQASIVKTRFEHDYGCEAATVEEIAGGSYEAQGCGERASYTCVSNNSDWAEGTCVREQSLQLRALRGRASTQGVSAPAQGKAYRRYDAQKQLQVVQADFRLTGAIELHVTGAPQAQLGDILVQLEVLVHKVDAGCETLEAQVNEVPAAATRVSTSSLHGVRHIAAHFDFQQFKPLTRRFPSFGIKHCSLEVKLSEADVAELQKFLVMYSDIAIEAQGSPAPQAEPTSAGTLEL